jgi:hypothetical protein
MASSPFLQTGHLTDAKPSYTNRQQRQQPTLVIMINF